MILLISIKKQHTNKYSYMIHPKSIFAGTTAWAWHSRDTQQIIPAAHVGPKINENDKKMYT